MRFVVEFGRVKYIWFRNCMYLFCCSRLDVWVSRFLMWVMRCFSCLVMGFLVFGICCGERSDFEFGVVKGIVCVLYWVVILKMED